MEAPGLLSVWNRIAAEYEAEFNAWYEAEHLAERLAVPGFRTARRYRSLDDPLAYGALYDTDSVAVMDSAAYRARLAAPTPRTRAIMARFLDMHRAASRVVADTAPGTDALPRLAIVLLDAVPAGPRALTASLPAPRVRLAVPDAGATGGATAEQVLRPQADRLPPPFLVIETAGDAALGRALAALPPPLRATPAKRFALLASRRAGP